MVLAFPLVLHSRKELVLRLRLPGWLETSVQFFEAKILKAVCLVPEVGISFGVERANRELKVEEELPYQVIRPIQTRKNPHEWWPSFLYIANCEPLQFI